jgi:hypothetical protein
MKFPELGKCPFVWITGDAVTPEQAKEIIRRTDVFFATCPSKQDDTAEVALKQRLGMPFFVDGTWPLAESWGLPLELFYNRRVLSEFNGFGGWCDAVGRIELTDTVGKWPTGEEVLRELEVIATAFPFLRMTVHVAGVFTLEALEPENTEHFISLDHVVTFRVHSGVVVRSLHDFMKCFTKFRQWQKRPPQEEMQTCQLGVPQEWIEEWVAQAQAEIQALKA